MSFYQRNRGAISVFLIIVLVPCIVISSIFVDLGRVHLSRTQSTAAADLALNTLLTNYDADLKDWYGMIGSCQNIDEFYKISAEYYLRNISSQGLNEDELMTLAGVFAAATGDDTIYDLLQVECQTEASAMITAVSGANLKNPALLRDQVVEFMKYRAPIEITKSLVGRLQGIMNGESKDDIGLSQFTESKENDSLVKAKQNFYDAEGDLMTAAYYSYVAIYSYDQKYKELKVTEDVLKQYANTINGYRDVYSQIHEISVQYLLNTSGLRDYTRAVYSLEPYKQYDLSARSDVWTSSKTDDETDETTYYINGSKFNSLMSDIRGNISGFEEAKRNYEGAVKGLMQITPGSNDINSVQWWDDMQDAADMYDNSVRVYGSSLLSSYTKLLVMLDCKPEAVPNPKPKDYVSLPADWETQCRELRDKIYSHVDNYLDGTPDPNDAYVKAADMLTQVSHTQSYRNLIKSTNHTVTVDGQSMTIDAALAHMSSNLSGIYNKVDQLIKLLDVAIDGDGDKTPSLITLQSLATTYSSKFKAYDSAADTSTTKMGETERGHVDDMEVQSEINAQAVSDLNKRLSNIRSQLKKVRDGINNLTYGGTSIKSISSFATFKTKALTKVADSSISVSVSSNKTYAGNTFKQLFKPASGNAVTLATSTNSSHDPNLSNNTPTLLDYMKKEFGTPTADQMTKVQKGEEDEAKSEEQQTQAEDKAKKNAEKYRGGGSGITTSADSTTAFKASDLLGSVVGTVKAMIGGDLDGIRDDIYVTTYIMEMFSYSTYDREAMYKMLSDEQKKAIKVSDPEATFKTAGLLGDASATGEQEGTWLSTKDKDTYNKSLTNHLINLNNNKSYLAEVEYILYGKATPAENLKAANGHIYTIRMLLNTVSAFQNFWSPTGSKTGGVISGIATAISAAFGGIIPAPVIKAVLIPMLALIESGMDIQRLAAGMPVELYKMSEDDWWVSLDGASAKSYTGFFGKISGGLDSFGTGKNKDKGIFYSEYLILFLYSGLAGGGDLENDMYIRMSELIEHNLRKQNGIPADYSLKKTQMYFTLDVTLRVKPLMATLTFFDNYGSTMETATDWCTYKIKITRGYS